MTFVPTRPTVTTTATVVADNTKFPEHAASDDDWASYTYLVKNVTASAVIYLGGPGVTSAAGFQWDVVDGSIEVTVEPGEALYGIVAAGSPSQALHVLRTGR